MADQPNPGTTDQQGAAQPQQEGAPATVTTTADQGAAGAAQAGSSPDGTGTPAAVASATGDAESPGNAGVSTGTAQPPRKTAREIIAAAARDHEKRGVQGDREALQKHGFLAGVEQKLNELAAWVKDHGKDESGKPHEFEGDTGAVLDYLRRMF